MPGIADLIAIAMRGGEQQPEPMARNISQEFLTTPGFNPDAPLPIAPMDISGTLQQSNETSNNLMQQLLSIANPQPEQRPGFLQTLLSAIPQAIGVATSNDPSAALLKQINDTQTLQQRQKERQQDLKNQIMFQTIQEQLGEQRQIRTEARRTKLEEESDVRKFERQFRLDEAKDRREFEQRKALAEISTQGQLRLAQFNADSQRALSELELQHKSGSERIRLWGSLTEMGLPDNAAATISEKVINNRSLTPDESKIINQITSENRRLATAKTQAEIDRIKADTAHQRRLAANVGRGGGSSSDGGEFGKAIKGQILRSIVTEQYVQLNDGSYVEASKVPLDPLTGQRSGVKRYLTPTEAVTEVAAPQLQALDTIINPRARAAGVNTDGNPRQTITVTKDTAKASMIDTAIRGWRKQGLSDDGVRQQLSSYLGKYPEDREQVNQALIRNRLNAMKPEPSNRQQIIQGAGGNPNLILPENLGGSKPIESYGNQSKRQF